MVDFNTNISQEDIDNKYTDYSVLKKWDDVNPVTNIDFENLELYPYYTIKLEEFSDSMKISTESIFTDIKKVIINIINFISKQLERMIHFIKMLFREMTNDNKKLINLVKSMKKGYYLSFIHCDTSIILNRCNNLFIYSNDLLSNIEYLLDNYYSNIDKILAECSDVFVTNELPRLDGINGVLYSINGNLTKNNLVVEEIDKDKCVIECNKQRSITNTSYKLGYIPNDYIIDLINKLDVYNKQIGTLEKRVLDLKYNCKSLLNNEKISKENTSMYTVYGIKIPSEAVKSYVEVSKSIHFVIKYIIATSPKNRNEMMRVAPRISGYGS